MIPTSIDGTDITGATIDGTDVQEITVDGQTVFTAAVQNPGFVIDDFGDNKLTGRDDFNTLSWQDASGAIGQTSDFTRSTRPEYDTYGSPTVSGGVFEAAGGTADRAFTGIGNADFTSTRNVDMKFNQMTAGGGYGVVHIVSKLAPDSANGTDGVYGIPPSTVSLVMQASTGDGLRLIETDSSGNEIQENRSSYSGSTTADTFDIQIQPTANGLDFTVTKGGGGSGTLSTTNIGGSDVNSVGVGTGELGSGTIEIDYAVWY